MKRLLLISLFFGLISPAVNAKSLCTLTSEEEPDVTITMKYVPAVGGGIGTLNYKNKPALFFEVGRWNGYGGEYYVTRSYLPESFIEGKKYKERIRSVQIDHLFQRKHFLLCHLRIHKFYFAIHHRQLTKIVVNNFVHFHS